MKLQTITQPADTVVLLRLLEGRHLPAKADRITCWILASVCVASSLGELARPVSSHDRPSFDLSGSALAVFLLALSAGVFLTRAATVYVISSESILVLSPIHAFDQFIPASDVRDAWLDTDRGPVLRFRSVWGRTIAVPVEGTLREALVHLYPELGHDGSLREPLINARYRLATGLPSPLSSPPSPSSRTSLPRAASSPGRPSAA